MQLLYEEGMIIGDIAKKLDLPASSTAFHLKILEEAGLIRMEKQPGTRGTVKLCIRKVDYITVNLIKKNADIDEIYSAEMPVGAFSSCQVTLVPVSVMAADPGGDPGAGLPEQSPYATSYGQRSRL